MSASAESQDSALPEKKPLHINNNMWVETYYWSFKLDWGKVKIYHGIRPQLFRIPQFEEVFFFKACKMSDTSFTVQLNRQLVDEEVRPDSGYMLDIYFTLLGSGKAPERRFMHCKTDFVNVTYGINLLKIKERWNLKCVIRIVEKTCLHSELYEQQTEMIESIAKTHDETGKKTLEMAFLLTCNSLNEVFSGRQDMVFATRKGEYIKRIFTFVSEIARKFARRIANRPYDTTTPLNVYLGYIYNLYANGISKPQSAALYLIAQRYGLGFLRVECCEFMLKNLDSDFIVDVLLMADFVEDSALLEKVLDVFVQHCDEILKTNTWKVFKKQHWLVACSIIDSAHRRATSAGMYQTVTRK